MIDITVQRRASILHILPLLATNVAHVIMRATRSPTHPLTPPMSSCSLRYHARNKRDANGDPRFYRRRVVTEVLEWKRRHPL